MHELSVCNALVTQVELIAAQNRAGRVARIELEVGPLSGVEPDLLRRAYPLAIAGTVAADAELVIDIPDVVVHCTECETESSVASNRLLCGRCGDFRTQIVSGEELILKRLELEDVRPDDTNPAQPEPLSTH
ncbi:MAG: hydrogenase maturation nickel metallochaperone HypA [Gammaproteobacteria bacterium]|nr:hydrogenase maturation nickel metallochaperone HypA [Gammaproteobacteria bacterium]